MTVTAVIGITGVRIVLGARPMVQARKDKGRISRKKRLAETVIPSREAARNLPHCFKRW
jgi:hypothetical protein